MLNKGVANKKRKRDKYGDLIVGRTCTNWYTERSFFEQYKAE